MKQQVLLNWNLPWLPVFALVIFVTCFSLYAWWTWRKENRAHYDRASLIPLDDSHPQRKGHE